MSGNFGYYGEKYPWCDVDQMWHNGHVGRYGGRYYVRNI